MRHKKLLERTNHGYYFSECACGWSGGVYSNRTFANDAYLSHKAGAKIPLIGKVGTTFTFGPQQ